MVEVGRPLDIRSPSAPENQHAPPWSRTNCSLRIRTRRGNPETAVDCSPKLARFALKSSVLAPAGHRIDQLDENLVEFVLHLNI